MLTTSLKRNDMNNDLVQGKYKLEESFQGPLTFVI